MQMDTMVEFSEEKKSSRKEKVDYFWTAFDSHLRAGKSGREALLQAADDYCFVFFDGDGRSEIGRAAMLALEQLGDRG